MPPCGVDAVRSLQSRTCTADEQRQRISLSMYTHVLWSQTSMRRFGGNSHAHQGQREEQAGHEADEHAGKHPRCHAFPARSATSTGLCFCR